MVDFVNIGWDKDYLWADAEDLMTGYKTHVTLLRYGKYYDIPFTPETGRERAEAMKEIFDVPIIPETRQIRKAMLTLVSILHTKGTLPEERTVAWG